VAVGGDGAARDRQRRGAARANRHTWFDGVPKVYDVLAREPGAIVAEAPFPIPQQWFLNAPTW
jgi:hypothetical protein